MNCIGTEININCSWFLDGLGLDYATVPWDESYTDLFWAYPMLTTCPDIWWCDRISILTVSSCEIQFSMNITCAHNYIDFHNVSLWVKLHVCSNETSCLVMVFDTRDCLAMLMISGVTTWNWSLEGACGTWEFYSINVLIFMIIGCFVQ